jgi:hypothetical protein
VSHRARRLSTFARSQRGYGPADATAEATVSAIVKVAPAIERGVVSLLAYVQAVAGLIGGTNATPD